VIPDVVRNFIAGQRWAIEASVSGTGAPQAAIIGVALSDRCELVFDTLSTSRKAANLRNDPRIALVFGGWDEDDSRTVQIEGIVDFPAGSELERLRRVYYPVFPDGLSRLDWPELVYARVRPSWIRHSDYTVVPPDIREWTITASRAED